MKCIDCTHFAYWDGDFCCTWKMAILSHIEDGKVLNPEKIIEERFCDEYKEEECKPVLRMRKETWNNFYKDEHQGCEKDN